MTRAPERLPDWEPRLVAYLSKARRIPHAYGAHDCLLFVAGAVKAQTGKDFAKGHRGKYRSRASAVRYLASLGFDSPAAMIDAHLPERPITKARRGDIVLDNEGIPGVCMGGFALMAGEAGQVRAARRNWAKAWAVGE